MTQQQAHLFGLILFLTIIAGMAAVAGFFRAANTMESRGAVSIFICWCAIMIALVIEVIAITITHQGIVQ